MRASYIPTPGRPRRLARRDVAGNGGPPTRRRVLPRLENLLRIHPSEDRLPFHERVVYRLVSGEARRG